MDSLLLAKIVGPFMRRLTIKFVIPFTIISFGIFTKWWYVLIEDAPDEILTGFPLPYVCRGWHTSLSLQIFVGEFLVDLLIYFLFWFLTILLFSRILSKIKVHRIIPIALYGLSIVIVIGYGLFATNADNIFFFRRHFNMQIVDTGYKFVWQYIDAPVNEVPKGTK